MKWIITAILTLTVMPTWSNTLDLNYGITPAWNYCEIHRAECDRIAEYDDRILPDFDMAPPISSAQWGTFVALQLLDVYSTYQGLQFDCVRELNPILGDRPSIGKMMITKAAVLTSAINYDISKSQLDSDIIDITNFMMVLVLANNMEVKNRAKRRCEKR